MASNGLAIALMGLGNLGKSYADSYRQNVKDTAAAKEAFGLMELRKQQAAAEKAKAALALEDQGYIQDEAGAIKANPDFFNPESDVYKLHKQRSEFKRMQSPAGQSPRATIGQVFALQGKPVPKEFAGRENEQLPDSVAAQLLKPQPPSINLDPASAETIAKATGLPVQSIGQFVGSPAGRSVLNTAATGKSREEQGKRFNQQQERLETQADRNFKKSEEQFETNKKLQIANSTKSNVERVKVLEGSIQRMKEISDLAKQINPSGAEYNALKMKASANSYDPGNLPLFGGKPLLFKGLTPEEQQRFSFYQGLSTDAIVGMFEAGGKQLTPTEKQEISNLAITPNDTNQQIQAKLPRLIARLEKELSGEEAVIESFNKAAGESVQSPVKNISDKRAESAKKLGISDNQLKAIDKAPIPATQQGAKKFYSKSRNQTKIVYPDGREEIVDGKK